MTGRRGGSRLSTAQEEALLRQRQQATQELAVLVSVEFTSHRKKVGGVAAQARAAALLVGGAGSEETQVSPLRETIEPSRSGRDDCSEVDGITSEDGDSTPDFEASLAEFKELAESAGAVAVAVLVQRRPRPDPATLVGGGKLDEIVAVVESTGASLVLFDHDLTPSQARNVEARLPCTVIDRSQLILDIFARHARTREGMLQVELAQLEYQLPRLGGKGKSMSQTGGGIGTRGPGETKLETDRRKINTRIDHLKAQIEAVRRIRRQQRSRREAVPVPVVALVGYTNAGKSTLFNALTGANVLASKRMFATLDPKLRQMQLPSRRKILLSDTVGFVRDLPHALVSSFRATLEEVERAELLLHVRDASSAMGDEQKKQVLDVLGEIEVGEKPVIDVLNKMDLLPAGEVLAPGEVGVSALTGEGIEGLIAAIDAALVRDPLETIAFRIPQAEGRVIAAIERGSTVEKQKFEGNLLFFEATGPASLLGRYRRFWAKG